MSNIRLHMLKHLAKIALLIPSLLLSSSAISQATWNIVPGWNLLGNHSSAPLYVTHFQPTQSMVNSIWTWNNATSKWAFYAPSLSSAELATYAQSKGYEVLSSIASKQGFWVNATGTFAVTSPSNVNPYKGQGGSQLEASDLQLGWNLVGGTGKGIPTQFNQTEKSSLNAAGKDISSIWAWDRTTSTWQFFAPSLEAQGGSALTDYINDRGFRPFTSDIGDAKGMWINLNSIDTATLCTVNSHKYGEVKYSDTYKGIFVIPTPTQQLASNISRSIGLKDYYPNAIPSSNSCPSGTYMARSQYVETLNRIQQLGADQIWIYNFGVWDDFSKPVYTVNKEDYHIPESEIAFIVSEANKRNIKTFLAWQFTAFDKKGITKPNSGPISSTEFDSMMTSFHSLILDQAVFAEKIGITGISADWNAFSPHVATYRERYITATLSIIDDIRKVFRGKVTYGQMANNIIDDRIASKIDSFHLGLGGGLTTEQNNNLSVSAVKSLFSKQIRDHYENLQFGLLNNKVKINWEIAVQSKRDYFVNGWAEDGFCVNNCIQLSYITDFSVQAIGTQAALEAISEQTLFTNASVDFHTSYWLTDDITPTNWGWNEALKSDNYDFPNLSQSIRNKPAEGIVKAWFAR